MISKLVRKLETQKFRMPYYQDLIAKILIRNPEEVKFLLKNLLIFLEKNKKVDVLDITKTSIPGEKKWYDYRFLVTIRFDCSYCKTKNTEEQVNLKSPSKNSICEGCRDQMADYAHDAQAESDYMNKEKLKEDKNP